MTPPRAAWLLLWALHKGLRRVSGGRIGTRPPSDDRVGTLFIHTIGRKSGEPRTNGLYYLDDGPNVIVVASNAGADREPAWWLNLRAQPDAEVEMAGKRRPVRAREATAQESARLWPRLDAANPGFVAYRARVSRHIPIVILEPR